MRKNLLADALLHRFNSLLAGIDPHRLTQDGLQALAVGEAGDQRRTAVLFTPLGGEAILYPLPLRALRHDQQRQTTTVLMHLRRRFSGIGGRRQREVEDRGGRGFPIGVIQRKQRDLRLQGDQRFDLILEQRTNQQLSAILLGLLVQGCNRLAGTIVETDITL